MLWTAGDASQATGGTIQGDWSGVDGISIDTREISSGDLFVALIGDNRDGHAFVASALEAGAGAAMVTHAPDGVPADAPLLIVDDTLDALRKLGAAARARTAAKVIAVTGSVGKTSTKDMLRAMLATQGRVHAAVRSFNNHWGVPLTLARMPANSDWAVIEIGMNQGGEIAPLSHLTRPHVAMITTVAAVHLAAFDGIEQIADAKAEIFAGLEPGGVAVVNSDIDTFPRLEAAVGSRRMVTFGQGDADYQMVHAVIEKARTLVEVAAPNWTMTVRIGTPGAHLALNAVGALAVVEAAGGDAAEAARALADWTPPEGRGRRVIVSLDGGGDILLLDESYNANPISVAAALQVLSATGDRKSQRIAILGDMLELGPGEIAFHEEIAKLPAMEAIGKVHCCGPLMAHLWPKIPTQMRGICADDSAAMAEKMRSVLAPGDVCMVKGSLGARMGLIVEAIKGLGAVRDATNEDH